MFKRAYKISDKIGEIFIKILIVIILSFLVFPVLLIIISSFNAKGYIGEFPPESYSLRWYYFFIENPSFIEGLKISFVIGIFNVIFSVIISIGCAYIIVRHINKGRNLVYNFFISPAIIPGVVIGFALFNFFIALRIHTFAKLLIAHILLTFPYTMRTISGALEGFDRSIEEAALMLGASEMQTFLKITLPNIKSGIIASAIFALSLSLDDVAISVFLVDATTSTFPIVLLNSMRYSFNPSIMVGCTLLVIVAIIFCALLSKTYGLEKFIGVSFK